MRLKPRPVPYDPGSGSEDCMTSLTHLSGVRTAPIGTLKHTRPSDTRLPGSRSRFLLCLTVLVGGSLLGSSLPQSATLAHSHLSSAYTASRDLGIFGSNEHSVAYLLSATTQAPSCRGRCLDPHPGTFRQWTGQQNGCWVQVWRSWPEGCQHYQWYNSCNGYWDSYPNGAPRVYWNCCVH